MNRAQTCSKRLALPTLLTAALLTVALLPATALAQVFDPGPSAPALFDVVINLPEDEVTISGSIGGVDEQTTQLNVGDGGTIESRFSALAGGEVNVSGGSVGLGFLAAAGSEVNLSGGEVRGAFTAEAESDVTIVGGEFRLDNADFTGGNLTLDNTQTLSGTLADGTVFIFNRRDTVPDPLGPTSAQFSSLNSSLLEGVTLAPSATPLPPVDLTPIVVDSSTPPLLPCVPGKRFTYVREERCRPSS